MYFYGLISVIIALMAGSSMTLVAQTRTISSTEAQKLADVHSKTLAGTSVELGIHPLPLTAIDTVGRRWKVLEESGLIARPEFVGPSKDFSGGNYRIFVNPAIDRKYVREFQRGDRTYARFELLELTSPVQVKETRHFQGGKTKWDGVILLATFSAKYTPLGERYYAANNRKLGEQHKIQIFARYDAISGKWGSTLADIRLIEEPFGDWSGFLNRD